MEHAKNGRVRIQQTTPSRATPSLAKVVLVSSPDEVEEFAAAEETLRAVIDRQRPGLGSRVKIQFTNNSCTMVSKYERAGITHLRVHHLFRKAPRSLLRDLVRFCFLRVTRKTSRRVRADLMDFLEQYREETLAPYPKSRKLPPNGQCYDLSTLLQKVRFEYFRDLQTEPEIAWTRQTHKALMGKWVLTPNGHRNLILINRLLDDPRVPKFYVEFVIFHELLHELMPMSRECGRWVHHPPKFQRRERKHPDFRAAQRWEEDALPALCRRRRRRHCGR